MKIDSSSTSQIAAVKDAAEKRAAQTDTQASTGSSATTSTSATQEVNLSALSTDLRTSSASDVDTAKVASIKAALANGTYTPDSSKIADGMLSSAAELLQPKTSPTGG